MTNPILKRLLVLPVLLLALTLPALAAAPRPIATVYVFLSTRCPISNRYSPRLASLSRTYGSRGLRFVGVYSESDITVADMRHHAREHGLTFPLVLDPAGRRARLYGASVTPEVAIVDTTGALYYRGRVDDSDDPTRVTSRDLQAALDALLHHKPAPHARTRAFGCVIEAAVDRPPTPSAKHPAPPTVTYADDIAPILNASCVSCHREGDIGPMPLNSYKNAAAWATQLKIVTQTRRMPPWKADSHGEFYGENRLTDAQIARIAEWAAAGAPEGDPSHLAPPPADTAGKTGWPMGEPDAIFEMPTAYSVSADGKDVYRCFVIPTNYAEDRWIAGIDIQPGNRSVDHHATVFIDTSGAARRMDAQDAAPGYLNPTPGNGPGYATKDSPLGGWTPGHRAWRLPDGIAERLPKGADLVLEVHYHSDGKPETDRTRFGLYFAKGPVEKRLRIGDVSTQDFHIPPGDRDYVVRTAAILPFDITTLSVTPHMHNLGTSMRVIATLPDGTVQPIIAVENWDFNWQPSYRYRTPLRLPRGTRIDLEAHFDNSADNPVNPNRPPKEVIWGESTVDEMCTCFFAYTLDSEHLSSETVVVPTPTPPASGAQTR